MCQCEHRTPGDSNATGTAKCQISDEIYKSTSRLLLKHAMSEYDDLSETWRALEHKAQANVTIAGIFIAALALSFRFMPNLDFVARVTAFLTLVGLTFSALQSLRVMLVKSVETLEDSSDVRKAARTILESTCDQDAKKAIRTFVFDRLQSLERINQGIHRHNEEKARKLHIAQWMLVISVVCVIIAVFFGLFEIGVPACVGCVAGA